MMDYYRNVFNSNRWRHIKLLIFILFIIIIPISCFTEKNIMMNDKLERANINEASQSDNSATTTIDLPINVSVINDKTAWLINRKRKLMRTLDGGKSWEDVFIPSTSPLENVFLLEEMTGWVINSNAELFFTKNGGESWKLLYKFKNGETDPSFITAEQVYFFNELNGWIVETFSIRKTTNGGVTWRHSFKNESPSKQPIHLGFLNDKIGYFCTNNGDVYKTINGGSNWENKFNAKEDARGVYFVDTKNGWLVTRKNIYKTIDAGESWQKYTITENNIEILSASFVDQSEGWLAGYEAEQANAIPKLGEAIIFHTINGGASWRRVKINSSEMFFNYVYFTDAQKGWVFGQQKLYKTENSGINWSEYSLP